LKIRVLIDRGRELKYDQVATGHWAIVAPIQNSDADTVAPSSISKVSVTKDIGVTPVATATGTITAEAKKQPATPTATNPEIATTNTSTPTASLSDLSTSAASTLDSSAPSALALQRACNLKKDQSYVLSRVGLDSLPTLNFPLGELRDTHSARAYARKRGFQLYDKPDSQDV
jgi:hypothetical protein